MSVFCIILAVFLVTVIFGMADMFIRSQIMQAKMEDGDWHIMIRDISKEQAAILAARPDVIASSWYDVINFRGEDGYTISGKQVIICGSDESFLTKMNLDFLAEGGFPKTDQEGMLSDNAKKMLGLQIGDTVTIDTPNNSPITFTISGFTNDTSKTRSEDSIGVFLRMNAFQSLFSSKPGYYVQFSSKTNIQTSIQDIKSTLNLLDTQVSENTKLLGLLGQSGNSFMMEIYGSAFILFLLVLFAGIMMIASSLNSNTAERIEFYGMMRCIGATPKQVMHFVRKEALFMCRWGIAIGIAIGMVIIWILCAMLRFLSPNYFIGMPAFGISVPSMIAGTCVGLLTVLLAARFPAKRASRVSPLVAVSQNVTDIRPAKPAIRTSIVKIDHALGIHHALASKRNFVLMVASFSLSIILFLSFSVTIDFMNHTLTPLKPWTPDLSIISPDHSPSIEKGLLETLQTNPAVEKAYGRIFAYDIPITVNGKEKRVDLITYETHQFKWAKDYLIEGSVKAVQEEENTALVVFKKDATATVGDTITLNTKEGAKALQIRGILSSSPFNNAYDMGTVICSERTFFKLIGPTNYTIIDVQLSKNATEADVSAIHKLAGMSFTFADERLGNASVIGSFYSFGLFIYGFMTLIALITIFNIINSIAMSVSSRMKQYGAFRAIGLSNGQLIKMIRFEALTYAIAGTLCGGIIGLYLNQILYEKLITSHWGEAWVIPYNEITIIVVIVFSSITVAVKGPAKRISNMSIVDTISAK